MSDVTPGPPDIDANWGERARYEGPLSLTEWRELNAINPDPKRCTECGSPAFDDWRLCEEHWEAMCRAGGVTRYASEGSHYASEIPAESLPRLVERGRSRGEASSPVRRFRRLHRRRR